MRRLLCLVCVLYCIGDVKSEVIRPRYTLTDMGSWNAFTTPGPRETLTLKIPPGTTSGQKLRLRGKGAFTSRGQRGDLIVEVTVNPHPFFKIDGRDLILETPITVNEALLGVKVEVPTLEGPKTMSIPPGTSSGARLRLKGQGVPARGTQPAGDMYVVTRIVVPRTIDDETKAKIAEIAASLDTEPRKSLWK